MNTEPTARKSITLPVSLWDAIDAARRSAPGRVPSETELIRTLIREALDARAEKEKKG